MHHHHHQPISDWSLSCSFHPFVTVSLLFIRGTFPCWFLPQPSPYWYLPASWENILPQIFSLFHLKNWNIIGSPVWWDLSELSLTARLVLDSCLGPRPAVWQLMPPELVTLPPPAVITLSWRHPGETLVYLGTMLYLVPHVHLARPWYTLIFLAFKSLLLISNVESKVSDLSVYFDRLCLTWNTRRPKI